MNRLVLSLVCLAVFSIGTRQCSAGPIDYVFLTSNEFGTMDVENGTFNLFGPASSTYEDMTRLPGGVLYAVDNSSRLLIINQSTGGISSVIGTMGNGIAGAKLSANGILFGYNRTDLYTINTANAHATLIGAFGIPTGTYYDAAFNGNKMYLEESNGAAGISNLYTVNTGTGAATLVGNIGYEVFALSFSNGSLYGFTSNGKIVSVNTTTGAGTFVANQSSGNVFSAATAASAVPEPSSLAILGTGMAGICMFLRRRPDDAAGAGI